MEVDVAPARAVALPHTGLVEGVGGAERLHQARVGDDGCVTQEAHLGGCHVVLCVCALKVGERGNHESELPCGERTLTGLANTGALSR